MQLSLSADYGCRVLIFLSVEGQGSIPQISRAYGISQNHLVKVVHRLSRLGFVNTTRGRGGGISLAKAPEEIRVGEVIRQLEPHLDVVECFNPERNSCVISPHCGLKGALKAATNAFLTTLDQYTFRDITHQSAQLAEVFVPPARTPSG